jgi:hypothetical protein
MKCIAAVAVLLVGASAVPAGFDKQKGFRAETRRVSLNSKSDRYQVNQVSVWKEHAMVFAVVGAIACRLC